MTVSADFHTVLHDFVAVDSLPYIITAESTCAVLYGHYSLFDDFRHFPAKDQPVKDPVTACRPV